MKSLRKLRKDHRGSTAVEFALLALPFFGMIVGIIQLGLVFLANQTLDEAVDFAARDIQTGDFQQANRDIDAFRTAVCNNVALIADCTQNIQVSVQSFANFDNITRNALYSDNGNPVIVNGTYFPGNGGDIVVVSASVNIPIVAGSLFGIGGNGMQLSSSVAFRNEAFTLPSNSPNFTGNSSSGTAVGSGA